jgi:hypothetical protein
MKKIGYNIWFHKNYAKKYGYDIEEIDYKYNIVKVNTYNNNITLLYSPDFDLSDEPYIESYMNIMTKEIKSMSIKNKVIYHHKWMFVEDDYNSFSLTGAKLRSELWLKNLDLYIKQKKLNKKDIMRRIGYQNYWTKLIEEIFYEK